MVVSSAVVYRLVGVRVKVRVILYYMLLTLIYGTITQYTSRIFPGRGWRRIARKQTHRRGSPRRTME